MASMAVGGVVWLTAVIVVAITILLLIKKVQKSHYGVKTGIVGLLSMIKNFVMPKQVIKK